MRALSLLLGFALTTGAGNALSQPAPDAPPPDAPAPAPPQDGSDEDTDEDAGEAAGEAEGPYSKGTLIIRVRSRGGGAIQDASVTIDARSMGDLEDGELTLTNIPPGSHAVSIDAAGYQRFAQAVMIRDGEHARLDAVLVDKPPPPPPRYSPVWKWTLGASVAIAAGGLGFGLHSASRMRRNNDAVLSITSENGPGFSLPLQYADCGKAASTIDEEKHLTVLNMERFERTCTWRDRMQSGYITMAIGAAGIAVSAAALMRHRIMPAPQTLAQGRAKREIAVVPMVAPGGGGASLTLIW
jgi:hypothetical protein